MNRQLMAAAGVVLVAGIFVGINMVSQSVLRGARLDLTSEKLYTLTEGARAIARNIEEPLTLTFYFTEKAVVDRPEYRALGKRVQEVAEEFVKEAGGKITLKVIKPDQFSEELSQAEEGGIRGQAINAKGERFVMGILGTNTTGGKEVMQQFDPRSEQLVEYDIAKLIYALKTPPQKKIGVMATVGNGGVDQAARRMIPPWSTLQLVGDLLKTNRIVVSPTATEIDPKIEVLVLVHPKKLSDQTLYAIDQFVMRGGRLLAFVDPLCTFDPVQPTNQMEQMLGPDKSSSLEKLLSAWGVEVPNEKVVGDRRYGPTLRLPPAGAMGQLPPFLVLRGEALSKSDEISRDLQPPQAQLYFAGEIRRKEGAKTPMLSIEPILSSSEESGMMEKAGIEGQDQLATLSDRLTEDGAIRIVAARLTGHVKSAFPGGPPADKDGKQPDAAKTPALTETRTPANIVLVADVDMLADQLQTDIATMGMQQSGNGSFLVGALASLSGSPELLAIRPRGAARTFERVDRIRKEAGKEYRDKERKAQKKLDEADQRAAKAKQDLTQALMDDARLKANPDQAITLTEKQRAKVVDIQQQMEEFEKTASEAKRELNKVKRDQTQAEESLGRTIKIVNIGLVPASVALLAVGLGAYRAASRRADRRRTA